MSIEKLHIIKTDEPFASLFSGGKDCGMALALACKTGKPVRLIHSMDNNVSSNHNQSIGVIQK